MRSLFLLVAIFLILNFVVFAQNAPEQPKTPVVLINGNGGITVTGGAVGAHGFTVGQASASKHDQTIEMAQQILKHCPELTVTLKIDPAPDYALLLNRETVGLFGEGISQIMLVRGSDQKVLFASKKGTVAQAVREGCKAIGADWKQIHSSSTPANGPWNLAKPSDSK